jgi:hypothetical protein
MSGSERRLVDYNSTGVTRKEKLRPLRRAFRTWRNQVRQVCNVPEADIERRSKSAHLFDEFVGKREERRWDF